MSELWQKSQTSKSHMFINKPQIPPGFSKKNPEGFATDSSSQLGFASLQLWRRPMWGGWLAM